MNHAPQLRSWVIILVDDDQLYLETYKRGLETFSRHAKEIELLIFSDALDALKFSTKLHATADVLWVLDSMMPCDEDLGEAETREGLLTGIVLLHKICGTVPDRSRHRFLVVTNYDIETVQRELENIPGVEIHSKLTCSPKQLARLVDQQIEGAATAGR
jgi:hypothetical protein